MTLLGSAFYTLWKARRELLGEDRVFAQVLTASLVGFVVAALFLSQAYSPYLYTLLGMTLGLARMTSPTPDPWRLGMVAGRSIPGPNPVLSQPTGT